MKHMKGVFVLAAAVGMAASGPALAQTRNLDSGDTAWIMTASASVLMMTIPGLALFYGGMVRKKNVLSTVIHCFAATCLITVLWIVVGYSLAFSEGWGIVGGFDRLFLAGLDRDSMSGSVPETVFIVFQMSFAIITAALITGAVAERMKFSALFLFLGLWSIVVYSPVAHWVWGHGFLEEVGVLDFAGGTVVHINAGVAALIAAVVLGKRAGYGRENMTPHNVVLTVTGAGLLWVGWFGFNAGSALAADGVAGMAMLVTQVAPATAALAWMFSEWTIHGKPSVLGIASGAVSGLAAITPAAGFVGPEGAIAIGMAAGVICFWGATWLKYALGYDDSLDVFAIHGLGGITGAVLTGVFAAEAIGGVPGAIEGNTFQVAIQAISVLVTAGYCAIATFILLMVVWLVTGLRVEGDQENQGLDIALHGESVT